MNPFDIQMAGLVYSPKIRSPHGNLRGHYYERPAALGAGNANESCGEVAVTDAILICLTLASGGWRSV
jgi:hypothetical protein